MKTKTLNIPDVEFAYINALKEHTGKGRNKRINSKRVNRISKKI